MDDIEAVFKGLQGEEKCLGFVDEVSDLVGDDATVRDILVEEEGGCEGDGLEGSQERADETREDRIGL